LNKIFNAIKRLGQKIKSHFSREFLTYLVFLLIAMVIWYMNALNKTYTDEERFAVRYSDLPDDKVLANIPDEYLSLTINAQGFTLLKYRLGLIFNPITLEASYQTLRRNNKSAQGEYHLVTQSVFDKVSTQLSSDVRLIRIEPDTLTFLFSETTVKSVAVKATVQLQLEKDFLPKGVMIIEPVKVNVIGPMALVDTMQFVYTRTKTFKKLKDTFQATVELLPVKLLRYSSNEVSITQVIERHVEATIQVPIEPVNLPKEQMMRFFPGTVSVNCMVPISDYEKLQPYMFRAVVDYASIRDVQDNQAKAKVTILRTPDFVTDVKFFPKNVDFIIEK